MAPWGSNFGFFLLFWYLEVKGDGLLVRRFPLQLYWIHTETYMKEEQWQLLGIQKIPKQIKSCGGELMQRKLFLLKQAASQAGDLLPSTDPRRKWADVKEKEARWEGRQQDLSHRALWEVTLCTRKDTTWLLAWQYPVRYSRISSLKMIVWQMKSIRKSTRNPRILWIRRIWLDLRAFFLGLISVMTDFPSNIELGSPWGTPCTMEADLSSGVMMMGAFWHMCTFTVRGHA